ncbi:unnamed protein product [Prorocentrum cordatum]|uniref:Carrier domain-containing protein n=1 Tax=Prorocentrum cordatum TaxID=2364126 RepID=A0ABN9RV35_9DINO|nr:unnamed protein product [Polarella glacialis]
MEVAPATAELLAVLQRTAQCDAATAMQLLSSLQVDRAEADKAEADKVRKDRRKKEDRIRTSPDFCGWTEARRAKIMAGPATDARVDYYSCLADDAAQSPSKREAAILLSAAEDQLEGGLAAAALATAGQAAEICAGLGDAAGEADALRLAVHAHRLQAELARWSPIEHGGVGAALQSTRRARELAEPRLQACRARGDARGAAVMLLCLAEVDADAAPGAAAIPEAALQGAAEACRLFREAQDRRMEAAALLALSRLQSREGRAAEARRSAEEALALYQVLGSRRAEAAALHALAVALALDGDVPAGLQAARDALDAAREAQDPRAAALELVTIAALSLDVERPNDALPAAQEAMDACRTMEAAFGLCAVAEQIAAEALVMKDETARAVELALSGLERCQESGDKREEAFAQVTLAQLRACAGDGAEAAAACEAALAICRDLEDERWAALVRLVLAQALREAGDAAGAERSAQEAEAFFAEDGDERHEATAATLLSSLLLERGEHDRARQSAQRGQELFREAREAEQELVAQLQVAACSLHKGELAEALSGIEEVLQTSKDIGFKRGEVAALSLAIDVHRVSGDAGQALEAAKNMRRAAQEAGSRKLETTALYHIARVHIDRGGGEAKLAARAADAAGKGAQKLGHRTDQVYMLILAAEARLEVIRELSDSAGSERLLRESASRCLQNIGDAVALAERTGRSHLQALATYFESVVLLALRDNQGATVTSQRSRGFFREAKDQSGEAAALLISGAGDEEGVSRAAELLESIAPKPLALPAGMPPWYPRGRRVVKKWVKKEKAGLSADLVTQTVTRLAKEAIQLDEVELHGDSPLMDSGMDSLTAVSFRNSVQSHLNLKISAAVMFDYPTIKEVTGHILTLAGGGDGDSEYEEVEVEVEDDGPPPEWLAAQGAVAAAPAVPAPEEEEKPKGLDHKVVMSTVKELAKQAIQLDEKLEEDGPLMDSGMDSLTSVAFRNSLQQVLGIKMPASLMFDYPTMREITDKVVQLSLEQ